MTDRQTLAVAKAIYNSYWQGKDKWPDATDNERAMNIDMAKAAIAASDARFVPMLAKCLRVLASRPIASWYSNESGGYYAGWDDAEYQVKKTLEQLPKEYRE